ncbi:phage holin family protein [Qipengyuania oceanensis]|uniref:Phage holin family protein n=1 Tax=Qipengyuania oceanensis TaxID=1463597 RepID=A0A844YDE5_9SPHN|nr:phage holin family protein [Qipengyuania oceanensis]MXO61623.1 phage holin family protein [Qipengyuania oceanensis]
MLDEQPVGEGPRQYDDEVFEEDAGHGSASPSLTDDLVALIDDGKTYVESEVAFQKTRLAFTATMGKGAALYGVAAFALLHLALVALVVGSVIALTPILTPFGATALVTAVLVLAAILLVRMAKRRFDALSAAYSETKR